jgi:epoxyqueuosine reductase
MKKSAPTHTAWLIEWMARHGVVAWGIADLRGLAAPADETGVRFPFAVSWALPLDPEIMASVRNGPNAAYAEEYSRLNRRIDTLSGALEDEWSARSIRARALAASARTDPENMAGEFPHKTAATRAGLGWVGRHCQLVTRAFGPWVRLGTVFFADAGIAGGPPIDRSFCDACRRCVDACPAKALTGNEWRPGTAREELLDAKACDQWKTAHYFQYNKGHNCGICSAVCPYGLRTRSA